ncbi:tyrosine-type recombinase/integrase [Georgenia sp. AZ-5]|uniref:tyrosine-type recombinase/integrase n=1 Tax=Georgenia sp. AZ-5 TaxID=3367526 RepID=UPI003754D2FE
MSIQKRPDGKYRVRYRDEAGKERARHFKRKVDAKRFEDEVTASKLTGQYVDPTAGKLTFRQFYEDWKTRQIWAPRTISHMDTAVRCVTFADIPLRGIRTAHVEMWVKRLQDAGLAPTTIASRFTAVRTIFRAAVTDRRIPADPTASVKTPRKPRRDNRLELPRAEQVGALLRATEPRMRAYIALCAFAGLRLGEASAVKLDDIDFLHRTLHVERQIQDAPGKGAQIQDPKYGSKRAVYLPEGLLQILAAHVEQHGTAPDGWLFSTVAGKPLPPSTVDSWWRRTTTAASITGVHLHGLRHFFASGLIAKGCDVVTVQRALGHARPSMTLDTYSHLWPSAEDRTRKAVAAMLAETLQFQTTDAAVEAGADG